MISCIQKSLIFIVLLITLISCSKSSFRSEDKTSNLRKLFEYEACIFETDSGSFEIMLYKDACPVHSENFRKLVEDGFYKGISFHRVIRDFVIQAGDEATKGTKIASEKNLLPAEISKFHGIGSVGAARTDDKMNPARKSNPTQFYICLKPQPDLNRKYTIFGRVTKGMENVLKIGNAKTDKKDQPLKDIRITNCYLAKRFDEVKYKQFQKLK